MDFSLSSSLVGNAVSNPDKLALDLQFSLDKTLTARKGPTPVFTRGSGATFVDSDKLVKWAPENLSLYSGAIATNIGWNLINATSSLSGSAPNGNAAYQVSEEATSLGHAVLNTGSLTQTNATSIITGITYTGSIFLKKVSGSINWVQVSLGVGGFGDAQYANFNIETGTVGNFAGLASGTSPQIVSFGDGWYRCSISVTANATVSNSAGVFVAFINNTNGTTRLPAYLGSPSNSILASMCQLERSSTARTYIPTTTAAVYGPRFDHDPVTGVCKGLLMEESRTNIMPRSQDFTTGWTVTNLQTVTSGFTSPSGDSTACSLVENNLSGIHSVQLASPSAVTAGSPYTGSVYAKENGATSFQLVFSTTGLGAGHANFVLSGNGSIGTFSGVTATIERLANGWYRCSMTVASAPGSGANSSILVVALNDNNSSATRIPSYLGDNATGVFVWGAQLELGAFPTSYIPTTTGTLTRSADVCTITGSAFNGFYNQPSGTLESEVMIANLIGNNRGIVQIDDNTNNSVLRHVYGLSDGGFRTIIRANADAATTLSTTLGTASVIQKRALAYEGTSFASVTNGGAVTTITRTMPVGLSILRIGNLAEGSFYLSGHIAAIRYYKKRLSNAKLASLTV